MSTALQKQIEREFFKWIKGRPADERTTLWQAFLQGYLYSLERAREVIKEGFDDARNSP